MAGQSPNSTNIDRVASATSTALHLVCHPEYLYWRSEWQKLRDCISGEREIKRKGERYLKPMKGSDAEDYKEYLDRSTYYNMTAQTLNGMIGQVFRRDPQIRNLPTKFKNAVRKFGKDGSSHVAFTKGTVGEQLGVGRIGILVDAPATTTVDPTSFAVAYTAENILDWDMTTDDWGMYVPSRVLLREFERQSAAQLMATVAAPAKRGARTQRVKPQSPALATSPAYQYQTVYRELTLEPHPDYPDYDVVYVQRVYLDDPTSQPKQVIVPNVRGTPLTFIPFQFKGSNSITADIEKPPLLDIADLNLSHFRTYAELELGRTYTALPTYYAQVRDGQGASEYHIGPNRVWEVGEDQVPGILEYKGEGLKALETALATKEQQIAAIGGRLMPGSSRSISESNNQSSMREANEQALLLNVIEAAQQGMTNVVRWWLMWRDVPLKETESLRYEINRDFVTMQVGAREMRAMQQMYTDGIVSIEVFFEFLRKAEIVDSEMSLEDFKAQLNDPKSFINNPDAQARQRGFTDRAQELEQQAINAGLADEEPASEEDVAPVAPPRGAKLPRG